MRPVNLGSLDFNLLVVFEALMEERHVSRAAEKLGLSQPSLSHALRRLRELFDDKLFERRPDGMYPTARAHELAALILPGLSQIKIGLKDQEKFDPTTSKRRFVIAQPDIGTFTSLPLFAPQLRKEAPNVQISIRSYSFEDVIEKLRSGHVELAISVFLDLPADFDSFKITSLPLICIADRNNAYLKTRKKLDATAFQMMPHVALAGTQDHTTPVDNELSMLALRRHIALEVPHYFSLPGAVIGTDMMAVFDAHTIQAFADWPELAIYPFPFPSRALGVAVAWHKRLSSDPGHRWLREMILETHKTMISWTPETRKATAKRRATTSPRQLRRTPVTN